MFDKIKKKYPKAWEKFEKFVEVDMRGYGEIGDRIWHKLDKMDIGILSGWLFRFFDEQGIQVFITPNYDPDENMGDFIQGGVAYYILADKKEQQKLPFNSRTEAEESAFTKAFEILEEAK